MLAARETVVPVGIGREGLGMLVSRQSCAIGAHSVGKAELHPQCYCELSALFQYEENNNKLKCAFRSFKG